MEDDKLITANQIKEKLKILEPLLLSWRREFIGTSSLHIRIEGKSRNINFQEETAVNVIRPNESMSLKLREDIEDIIWESRERIANKLEKEIKQLETEFKNL